MTKCSGCGKEVRCSETTSKCGARGNQLDLWAALTKQSLYAAALDLCRRFNLDIPWLGSEQRRGTRKLD